MHEIKTVLAWTLRKFIFSTNKKLLDQGKNIKKKDFTSEYLSLGTPKADLEIF